MKREYSIRKIAELSGFSTATVSRAINRPQTVSEKTRQKVLEITRQYGYVPNRNVKNIFSGASNTIAIFVYDMTNPYFNSIISHLSRITFENSYSLLLFDCMNDEEKELEYYEYCKSVRVAGIVYASGTSRGEPPVNEETSFPIVILANTEHLSRDRYSLHSDDKKSLQLLTDYLYNLNHRKIGFITGPAEILSSQDRLNAFTANAARLGLSVPRHFVCQGDFSVQSGTSAFDYFFSLPASDRPTAVIASNDQMARGFILRANAMGIRIPEDISVCGIDSVPENYFYPTITSIRQDTERLAECAFHLIVNPEHLPYPQETVLDVALESGATCRKI